MGTENRCQSMFNKLRRKKTLPADIMKTPLKRCLNTFDLMLFGIGHMIGGGIYLLTGTVARQKAGPGVVFSYMIAGLVSILIAMCYAEFGSKIPKTGSAYMYTYIILGEFWAFFVGWNLVLEQAIGAAAISRVCSGAINAMSGGAIVNSTINVFGTIEVPHLSKHLDFMAVAILSVLTVTVIVGIHINAIVNNILAVTNVIFLSFIVIVSFVYAEPNNWLNVDHGGLLPFGFSGVLTGAAMCFFTYVGFDNIVQASEEAKNPGRAVPISTLLTMTIVTLLYTLVALALSMLVPYYSLDISAPFSAAFSDRGVSWMTHFALIATIIATATTTLANLYALSRLVYVIAVDRLFFAYFANINPKTQTPIRATVVFSLVTMIMAVITEVEELAEMLSAGALIAFSFLAVDILVLRYLPINECPLPLKALAEEHDNEYTLLTSADSQNITNSDSKQNLNNIGKLRPYFVDWSILRYLSERSKYSTPMIAIGSMCVSIILFLVILLQATDYLLERIWWSELLVSLFGLLI